MNKSDSAEEILAEIEAGIIPIQIFYSKIKSAKCPFENMPEAEARKLKRKWRKLKKKYGVRKYRLRNAGAVVKRKLKQEFIKNSLE
jgi:hypothetical protein